MARYKVILKYDGTAFKGMQRQKNVRTVQAEVEASLTKIGWQGQSIMVAGRTDSGVHASGQVIAFDMDWQHEAQDLLNAINSVLSQDASAVSVSLVEDDFHPRFDAKVREYRYQIFCAPQRDPLRERYAWRIWPQLEISILHRAAEQLVGTHDFASFGTPPKEGGETTRQVHAAEWQQTEEGFTFSVKANAFLYHMVRRMVSIQIDIVKEKFPVDVISEYLTGKRDGMIQGLAPPTGLFLTKVNYPKLDNIN